MPSKWSKTPLRDLRTYGTSRAPRLADCEYAGDEIIHLTICAAASRPFSEERVAAMVCRNVEFYCEKLQYRLFAYCLMPDHLHVLLSPIGAHISKWLHAFKSYTAHQYVRIGHAPPLWQRSAYDHVCRAQETAAQIAAYIADNPVRAGLIERWEDWRWTKLFSDVL